MRPDAFSAYHPWVSLLYFAAVLGLSMTQMHPVCLAVSLIGALLYLHCLGGKPLVKSSVCLMLPVLLLTALVNPAFNHQGVTLLCYLPTGNPLTLESIYYGVAAGMMLASVLLWFRAFGEVITSDKLIYLFGSIIPALSLLLSMTLRLIPKCKRQMQSIVAAQRCMGRDISQGSVWHRAKIAIACMSILITWALEDSIETADSMRSRGYGQPGRTAFSLYVWQTRDRVALAWILTLTAGIIVLAASGHLKWYYFPAVRGTMTPLTVMAQVLYMLLCLTPAILSRKESLRWSSIRSAI